MRSTPLTLYNTNHYSILFGFHSTIEMQDYAENRKLTNFRFEIKDGITQINTEGKYDSISAKFAIQIDENGISISNTTLKMHQPEKIFRKPDKNFCLEMIFKN